jgi:hypothetical protein
MTDANFCRQQAASLNGACVVKTDPNARRTNNSNAPFCVVSVIGGTNCSYSDINFCKQQADVLGGACIVNQNRWVLQIFVLFGMKTATAYLLRTESAVKHLFEGISHYFDILKTTSSTAYITVNGPSTNYEFSKWHEENHGNLIQDRDSMRTFVVESFALDTLCGAVLQIAGKALEQYGRNKIIPDNLAKFVHPKNSRYCIGRYIRNVPLGLIIYAARNQHTHYNDDRLASISESVFDLLATLPFTNNYSKNQSNVDPSFDLNNPKLYSYASNVLCLIGWNSYGQYRQDMDSLFVDRDHRLLQSSTNN